MDFNGILSSAGPVSFHCLRLHRGDDLLESIRAVCVQKNIRAGVVLSAVGCILSGRIRDASGVNIQTKYVANLCMENVNFE